jgi:hypothetical protein
MTDSTVIVEYGIAKLVIGNARAAADASLFDTHDFGLVVNCTPDLPFMRGFAGERVRVPVMDVGELRDTMALYSMLPTVLPRIDSSIRAGRSVLVRCHAGRQRCGDGARPSGRTPTSTKRWNDTIYFTSSHYIPFGGALRDRFCGGCIPDSDARVGTTLCPVRTSAKPSSCVMTAFALAFLDLTSTYLLQSGTMMSMKYTNVSLNCDIATILSASRPCISSRVFRILLETDRATSWNLVSVVS